MSEDFPKAQITFDRFHVVKLLNEAMDTVRKTERKEHVLLKGHKYTFLRNPDQLTSKQQEQLDEMITLYPMLGLLPMRQTQIQLPTLFHIEPKLR